MILNLQNKKNKNVSQVFIYLNNFFFTFKLSVI